MPCRVLLDQVAGAYADGDIQVLKALYAEDALISTVAEPDRPFRPGEIFSQQGLLLRTQRVGPVDLIPIDESAGLLHATVRTQSEGGMFRSVTRVWLLTFKDGVVYRQRVVESKEAAVALYATHGLDLGMTHAG